jgi:hypothetical protein
VGEGHRETNQIQKSADKPDSKKYVCLKSKWLNSRSFQGMHKFYKWQNDLRCVISPIYFSPWPVSKPVRNVCLEGFFGKVVNALDYFDQFNIDDHNLNGWVTVLYTVQRSMKSMKSKARHSQENTHYTISLESQRASLYDSRFTYGAAQTI